ncbi:MAG: TRAP transporter substrate-binding protein [Deltaproteobacteria bacterium]|nr:TRAP transporter substrate-binding protein [Deltaproteobacteria bacterium]
MKRRIAFLTTGIFVVAVFGFALLPEIAVAQTIKLTYANFPPAPTFPCVQMERWKTEVEKRTAGKVSVQTFPGSTLLDAKNMMDGVIAGQADIGNLCMAYQPGRFMVTNATALPLGFPDATVASLVLWDLYNKYKPEEFAKVKVLAMFACAPANIYAKVPVKTLSDLKGVRLRASGHVAELVTLLGGTPVGMPQSETPEALQKGVVMGAVSSLETLMDFKYAELCKYATIIDGPIYPFAVVMNWNSWNKLPQDVQKIMDDMGPEQSRWTGEYMDNHVKESIAWSKKNHNLEIFEFSKDDRAKADELVKPMIGKWLEEAKAKGLPAEAILADMRAFGKKYSK